MHKISITKFEEFQTLITAYKKSLGDKIELNKRSFDFACLNRYSIIPEYDEDRKSIEEIIKFQGKNLKDKAQESKAIACFLGLAIGDSLGYNTEFLEYDKTRNIITEKGFEDIEAQRYNGVLNKRQEIRIYSDDTSMALCLADSLLANDFKYDGIDLRSRFQLWLYYGLNNGGLPHSIGLGGNISISIEEFDKVQSAEVDKGKMDNNGNGSLMRLAPVPIAYLKDEDTAMDIARRQSLATHNGIEAQECCAFLTFLLIRLYKNEGINPKDILKNIGKEFEKKTTCESVKYLAKSQIESEELFIQQSNYSKTFQKFNRSIKDRNWNWQSDKFDYSPTRLRQNSSYIGSYCMDGLAMALHLCYHEENFQKAILRAVNMGGDSDTVGAIVGQIAGAMYGINEKMIEWYLRMKDGAKTKEIMIRAYKLYHRHAVKNEEVKGK